MHFDLKELLNLFTQVGVPELHVTTNYVTTNYVTSFQYQQEAIQLFIIRHILLVRPHRVLVIQSSLLAKWGNS